MDRPRGDGQPADVEPLGVDLDLATVVALHQRSHDRRAERLGIEWRIALAIWASLLLASAFAFESSSVATSLQESRWIVVAIGAALLVLVGLHWWYLATSADAMDSDRSYAIRLEQLAGLPIGTPPTSGPSGSNTARRWLQVCVTALLASGVVLAAAAAAPPLPCTTVTEDGASGSTTTITCPSPAGSG